MERREILKITAYTTGAAISMPLMGALLSGCKSDGATSLTSTDYHFFKGDQLEMMKTVMDIIIPRTDSPSATDVGVHKMMDHMIGTVYSEDSKKDFLHQTGVLAGFLGQDFMTKEEAEKESVIRSILDREPDKVTAAFTTIKQHVVANYLTSEEIGTKYLNYLPVPGAYEACIPLSDVDNKAWSI